MKTSPTYKVKKQKDGDYEVTLYNQTKVFALKEVVLAFMDVTKHLNETTSQSRLNKAVLKNVKDHHNDVVKMFEKLPKVKRAALANYLEIQKMIQKDNIKLSDVKKRHAKLKAELEMIHKVIPAEDKKPTKAEEKLIKKNK